MPRPAAMLVSQPSVRIFPIDPSFQLTASLRMLTPGQDPPQANFRQRRLCSARRIYFDLEKCVALYNALVRRVYNLADHQMYLFLNAVRLSAIDSTRARQGGLRVLQECNGVACFRSPSSMLPLSLGIRRRRLASVNTQHLLESDRTRCHRRLAPQRGAPWYRSIL